MNCIGNFWCSMNTRWIKLNETQKEWLWKQNSEGKLINKSFELNELNI